MAQWIKRKPTRKEIMVVLSELQRLVGEASAHEANDRDLHGHEKCQKLLEVAHDLCIEVRAFDPNYCGMNIQINACGYTNPGEFKPVQKQREACDGND